MKISKVINDLPNEMLLKIFAHLSIEDLALSIQHVSERWHQISKDDVLWRDAVFSPKNTMSNEEIILLLQNVPALKTFSTNSETKLKLILDGLHDSRLQIQHFDLQRSQTLSLTTLRRIVELFPDVKYLTLPLPKMMTTQIKWAQVLGQCKSLISLSFHNRHGYVVKGMLQPIANGCPSLQHIYLGHCEFSADDIQYFLERKKHQLVSFSATLRYTGVFTHLSECSKLEYLHIENNNNKLAYNDIKPLSQLKNLKSIRFLYCTDSIAENLQHFFLYESFSKIIELDLSHNFSIQDFGFNEVLKNLPMIKYLNMSSSPNLGDEGLRDIWRCSRLEHLDISKCALMTDKSVQYVSKG
ncbi:hypothetical protein C0J52_13302 [Blattella germanica]|nr:hypothetical protein C0J52_13302 [Blattella germanica]